MHRSIFWGLMALLLVGGPVRAQDSAAGVDAPRQAVSFNPILALFEVYVGEYERVITPNITGVAGVGYVSLGDEDDGGTLGWLSLDAKARFYPQGNPLEGFSIGAIVGYTRLRYEEDFTGDRETVGAPTIGVDLNMSWLLGPTKRWYVGTGIGAKRYFASVEDDDVSAVLPTGRLLFGLAF